MRSRLYYRQCAQRLPELRVKPHSSLFTVPKQYSRQIYDFKSPRVLMFSEEKESDRRYDDLELSEEVRDRATYRTQRYQQTLRRYHSRCVRSQTLQDKTNSSLVGTIYSCGNHSPGAYKLAEIDGDVLPNTWKMDQLRRFYA